MIMSRRKQAKPRAVLKHDTDDDAQQDTNLLDTKEDTIGASGEDDDEQNLEDEIDNEEQNLEKVDGELYKPQFKNISYEKEEEDYKNEKDKIILTKSNDNPLELFSMNADVNAGTFTENDDDVIEANDNSSDSFYSDLYSTHTSSSYSPSMSEGAATPNSLLNSHHHQHHLHHNNEHHPQEVTAHEGGGCDDGDGEGGTNNRYRKRRQLNNDDDGVDEDVGGNKITANECLKNPDGINNNNDDNHNDGGGDDDDIVDLNNGKMDVVEKIIKYRRNHKNNNDDKINNVCNDVVGSNGILSTKLRKIDRDLVKTEKMTSNSIKSGTQITANTSDGSYQCQFCDKSFPRLGYLKKHEQSHAEHLPFKCEYCARLFKHKRSRDRHTKLHTGDRRYRCPHCEAAFSRSDHLKIHMKTHDNQKPFQCTVCNRGYNTAAALTSHMQNHKKQAALLGTGAGPLNYSPRSTGSGSSNGSFNHKRRYATADNSPNRIDYRKHGRNSFISCIYCTKSDFTSLEQLNNHIQSMHENNQQPTKDTLVVNHPAVAAATVSNVSSIFQLSCEYCTMKFPSIPAMFQHMRTTHIDRLTSPNSYFEHFNRLAASGTFSPRLATTTTTAATSNRFEEETNGAKQIKTEEPSPKLIERNSLETETKDEEQISPTDLSQPKRRSQTPSLQIQSEPSVIEKPGTFLCNQCNAGLPDFDTFRAHLKTHVTQGMTTNLICHHCGISSFRDQTEYERHIISHFLLTSSEYNCSNNCNKVYTKPDDLQKHLFENHVLTLYKCSICSDLFDTKVAIQVHFACIHSTETKIFRCSACMETFRIEKDFISHIRTRHLNTTNTTIQCMFCRAICSSELEMHFHLAAHARQFRCPACPETFHVEFLLDRHMQTHHSHKDNSQTVSTYHSHYGKTTTQTTSTTSQSSSNNNNVLDYHAFATATGKNIFQLPGTKFYNPLQVDTNSNKHAAFMYGLGQRYFDTSKTLMDMYNNYHHQQQQQQQQQQHQQDKGSSNYFINNSNNNSNNFDNHHHLRTNKIQNDTNKLSSSSTNNDRIQNNTNNGGFSCGICERNDFRTENEVHSHRKIVHNLKTGVSLKCAYCNGNFKSRNELEHHMKTCHNSTGKHKCLICDEIFPSPAILAEHKLQHSKVGQSGKCSHCSFALNDINAFKTHLSEHNVAQEGQIPVQCICCRQTLNSDFEISLHAKFHTKSSNLQENVCALCLEPIPKTTTSSTSETAKVCEKCCRKHNLTTKFNIRFDNVNSRLTLIENRCNLCKMILPNLQRLQEHLIEHTFIGCEERGYSCYICSSVFTVPAGLLCHMNEQHGQNSRPYDCNLCTEKFFFRAELDNHLIEHEYNNNKNSNNNNNCNSNLIHDNNDDNNMKKPKNDEPIREHNSFNENNNTASKETTNKISKLEVKAEILDDARPDDEEEYIEVEKVAETIDNVNRDDSKDGN